MVWLNFPSKLTDILFIRKEGVRFRSPYTDEEIFLTPEKSIEIQNAIGADIMMQLDDVVHVSTTGPRVEQAMYRSIRWLDRCLKANKRIDKQNIFPIIQGGLDLELRKKCIDGELLNFETWHACLSGKN